MKRDPITRRDQLPPIQPRIGQIWERRDGSQFKIERIDRRYVYYWLPDGSRPQFRSIQRELLTKRYRCIVL